MAEERNLVVWNARNGIGQFKKKFESPKSLFDAACEYLEQTLNHPIYCAEQLRKPGKETVLDLKDSQGNDEVKIIPPEHVVEMPRKRAASWQAFALYCGCSRKYFEDFKARIKNGSMHDPEGHWENVIEMIGDMIFAYNFEGAAADQLNPMLIARYHGISEKVEQQTRLIEKKEVFKIGDMEFEL